VGPALSEAVPGLWSPTVPRGFRFHTNPILVRALVFTPLLKWLAGFRLFVFLRGFVAAQWKFSRWYAPCCDSEGSSPRVARASPPFSRFFRTTPRAFFLYHLLFLVLFEARNTDLPLFCDFSVTLKSAVLQIHFAITSATVRFTEYRTFPPPIACVQIPCPPISVHCRRAFNRSSLYACFLGPLTSSPDSAPV